MPGRHHAFLTPATMVCFAMVLTAQQAPPGKPADQPTFRSRVTMVPIDVRVVDSNGDPITDLKAEDFTILENGRRQQIRHFSTVTLTAEAREPTRPTFDDLMGDRDGDVFAPQNRRVFLILLGRGRVVGPVKEVEGLIEFVRERLLPQDLVAVQAYNRATAFTSHHEQTARLLEAFRERNAVIERDLENWFSGLRAIHVDPTEIPPHVQARIDDLFDAIPALAARTAAPGLVSEAAGIDEDIRRTAGDLERAETLAGRGPGLPDAVAAGTANRVGMSLDEYAGQQADLRQDVMGVFAGINYLRRIEGEKHLVFVTPKGISLPRLEQNEDLAAVASDGRVALHIVYTAGPAMPRPGPGIRAVLPMGAQSFRQMFALKDLRRMTEITGGQLMVFKTGIQALDRVDRATRFHYLLGYDSSDPRLDGAFRDVIVRVNRRGATVLHRQGYFATEERALMDRRAFLTAVRLAAAAGSEREVRDIELAITGSAVEAAKGVREILLDLHVRAPHMRLTEDEGRHVGALELAVHVADRRQQPIAERRHTIDVRLRPESVQRFLAEGTSVTVRVPIETDPFYVRVAAYDYGSDTLGTVTRKLR